MSDLITKESIKECRKAIQKFRVNIDKRLMGGNAGGKTSIIAKQYILREEDRKALEKLVGRLKQ